MFNRLFTSPRAVDRHAKSPLLEEHLRYLGRCALRGTGAITSQAMPASMSA
jgi:hypothetical protein